MNILYVNPPYANIMHLIVIHFQSEFVSHYDKRREYVSGFSGSQGDVIVTLKNAALWTDGRYHLQADDQLDCQWFLMLEDYPKVLTKAEWLMQQLPNGGRVGTDPKFMPEVTWSNLKYQLQNTSIELVEIRDNLVDIIWENHTSFLDHQNIFVFEEKYAGEFQLCH
jgi:Xaa-Pro aminopeptidase